MKKFTRLFFVLATVLGFFSCSDDEGLISITVDNSELAFDCRASSQTRTAQGGDNLNASSDQTWCNALITGGGEGNLQVSVLANTDKNPRYAYITLTADGCAETTLKVTQRGTQNPACELRTFELKASGNALDKNVTFKIDNVRKELNAMYLTWIDKTAPEMLIPTFTMTGVKAMIGDKEVVSGQTPVSFAEDFDLVVVGKNGDTQSYRISLNCPQINTELPVLKFTPDYEITSKDDYVKTAIELYSPHTKDGWYSTAGGDEKVDMRGRGNSTWGLPKKPYRIKFPSKFSPIGLNHAKAKSWTLLAHDMDKSLLRNALGFELSRELFNKDEGRHDSKAILFTPATQFVNVYKGNQYNGLYQMSDQLEQGKGRVSVEDLDQDSPAEDISGGYLVEADLHEGYLYSSKGIRWTVKYPKDDECRPEQVEYIKNFINQAETALYGSNFKDKTNGWRKYLDEKTLVDFVIVKELAGDLDGFTSIYIYKRRGVDKLFFGPVWDLDKGWGNDIRVPNGIAPSDNLMMYAGFCMPPYVKYDWFQRLWDDETFRAAVNARWKAKKNDLVARINKNLDEMPKQMYKAIRANFGVTEERSNWDGFAANSNSTTCPWPWNFQSNSGEASMPQSNYDAEIKHIRELTDKRVKVLDREFAK